MRVCINPMYNPSDQTEGGIRRVVDAMVKYLPRFGVEATPYPDNADLIVNHGTYNEQRSGVPTIASCHGLYWAGYDWPAWGADANRAVIDNMIAADAITVPSKWVGQAVTRGLWRPVNVIYHGVEASEWLPSSNHHGYVLWNKARTDPVSNHGDLDTLSDMMRDTAFVSTYGAGRNNTRIIGPQSHDVMKTLVQNAGVFLATPRETMGIGALEALSCGVPVAGWRYGGQEEVIIDGETGYLAEYGDYDGLANCVQRCFDERARLSKNARADVLQRWGWKDKVEAYAQVYQDVLTGRSSRVPRISVVMTCYNLGQFVNAAMESVVQQSLRTADIEVIVVDDCSKDNSLEVAQNMAEYYKSRGEGTNIFKVVRTPHNLGLSGARNFGAGMAKGKYLLFLDADDMLTTNALATMADFLDHHPELDIAFGGLETMAEQGDQKSRNPWPNGRFDYTSQLAHLNQLSYCSLMRSRVWKNLGGYRTRDWRAEDAGFWCRAASFGYHIGCATADPVLSYRMRSNSKSMVEREQYADIDGDWTSWFPWRAGAVSGTVGTALLEQRPKPELNIALVPFGAQGQAPKHEHSWSVRHHQEPAVSIIIPVGPEHVPWLIDALDSVMAQTCPSWECIVVFDNSAPFPLYAPWARFMYSSEGIIPPYEPKGAGGARNVGIRAARAPLVLFLDADDVLRPQALEKMLAIYAAQGGYVYCDTLAVLDSMSIVDLMSSEWEHFPLLPNGSTVNEPAIVQAAEWDQGHFLNSGYEGRPGCHSVTALVATVDALGVGGFDESMKALEDWEFYMRFAASGITGHLIAEPLFVYRLATGTRREDRRGAQKDLEGIIRTRYKPFVSGETEMCSCGSGGGGQAAQMRAAAAIAEMLPPDLDTFVEGLGDLKAYVEANERIRLKYVGDQYGAVSYKGPVSRETYRAGLDPAFGFIDVDPRDVEHLLLSSAFQVVRR